MLNWRFTPLKKNVIFWKNFPLLTFLALCFFFLVSIARLLDNNPFWTFLCRKPQGNSKTYPWEPPRKKWSYRPLLPNWWQVPHLDLAGAFLVLFSHWPRWGVNGSHGSFPCGVQGVSGLGEVYGELNVPAPLTEGKGWLVLSRESPSNHPDSTKNMFFFNESGFNSTKNWNMFVCLMHKSYTTRLEFRFGSFNWSWF